MFLRAATWVGRRMAMPLAKRAIRRYIGSLGEDEGFDVFAAKAAVGVAAKFWKIPLSWAGLITLGISLTFATLTLVSSWWFIIPTIFFGVIWGFVRVVQQAVNQIENWVTDKVGEVIGAMIENGDELTNDRLSRAIGGVERVMRSVA